jgi:hypothetical protein
MKEIKKIFKSPFFYFHANCGKVCLTDSDLFGLSRSTRCGCCSYQVSSISVRRVTRYDHFCVFHFFCILAVSMATAAILTFFNPPKAATHYGRYSYKVSWKESKFFLNPPFFVSMATTAKFVQPIPIFLAYLVPLYVDVVPLRFHQFLFGE